MSLIRLYHGIEFPIIPVGNSSPPHQAGIFGYYFSTVKSVNFVSYCGGQSIVFLTIPYDYLIRHSVGLGSITFHYIVTLK